MDRANPDLVVLPFQAKEAGRSGYLTLEQVLLRLNRVERLQIERSYPGAPYAVGWTIFRRTPQKYIHEGEPLFRFERGARKRLRQKCAIHYSLVGEQDALTGAHLHL